MPGQFVGGSLVYNENTITDFLMNGKQLFEASDAILDLVEVTK